MKSKLTLGITAGLFAASILFTGCAGFRTVNDNTPHTTITGKIAGQPFSIENPKDTILEDMLVEASTNGTARIKIGKLSTVMNSQNIDSTGEAGAKMITATGNAIKDNVQAAANAAGAFAAGAAKTTVAP